MERRDLIVLGFVVFVLALVVFVTSAELERALLGALGMDGSGRLGKRAPELSGISGYINADSVSVSGSIGKKVILVDFWTYSCVNCIRTLPYLRAWDARYRDAGLLIIGVHTPEFEFEKDYGNVKKAVEDNGILFPVALDNSYATWRAYGNHYWPAKYLIDKSGNVAYFHFGEGNYEETENKIRALLEDLADKPLEAGSTKPSEAEGADFSGVRTPEVYFGYNFRRAPLGNQPTVMGIGGEYDFKLPEKLEPNRPYLEGRWADLGDSLELAGGDGSISIDYAAREVNMVAGSENGAKARAFVDGKLVSETEISSYGMYRIARTDSYGAHRLKVDFDGGRVRAYTFTFG